MRKAGLIAAGCAAAFLLGGCPPQDNQPDSGRPLAPVADTTPAAAPAADTTPTAAPATETSGADTADAPAGEPNVVQSPITPGTYTGSVTMTETAHCTGFYASVAGADAEKITEWSGYQVTIDSGGFPELVSQTVDMGGIAVAYTLAGSQLGDNSLTVTWVAQVNFIDGNTGLTFFSLPGQQTDAYRMAGARSMQIEFMLSASTTDQYGTVTYVVKMTGELTRD